MPLANKRILVCDDDPVVRQLLQVNLELEGSEVLLSEDGEMGVRVAQSERPDLIILDVMMPGMDGYEVCEKLRKLEATRDIPIVFLSAMTGKADIEKGKMCGVTRYLTKPFDSEQLIDALDEVLG